MTSSGSGKVVQVADDVFCYTNQIVNVAFIGVPNDWVLVDAGMPASADKLVEVAEDIFGEAAIPKAIILTHGHFDHVGAAEELVQRWQVPVYAHKMELPYLTGEMEYNDPDPSVEGGLVSKLSRFFPKEPVNLKGHVEELPEVGTVPGLPEWEWIHTPGHAHGHISLFRQTDRTLIAGDAFTTVNQDEMLDVMLQSKEINGPPRYFTPDWEAAELSVGKLAALEPARVIAGHGKPMEGEELSEGLNALVANFKDVAVPDHGRYVDEDKS